MNLQMRAWMERPHVPGEMVDLFVRGEAPEVAGAVVRHHGHVKMAMRGLVSVRLPVAEVEALAAENAVRGFEFKLSRGVTLNDTMRVKNHIEEIQQGMAPLPSGYDGEGVIIGFIDSGMDLSHPDFQDAQGHTRVLRYWNQNSPFDAVMTPQPYGYGQVWDSTMINAGQVPPGQGTDFGHGSTVAGTAAGNGLANGLNKGVAPMADIIMVHSNYNAANWTATVADAVKYIVSVAEDMGRPVVVNASVGDYYGSHDGLDGAALLIDSIMAAAPGRMMVCAAGNSGFLADYHVRTDVTTDTSFTWFKYKPTPNAFGYGVVYFDLWADTADFANVVFAVGADRVSPTYQFRGRTPFHGVGDVLDMMVTDTLWSLGGDRIAIVDMLATPRDGQVHMEFHMATPDSTAYNFRLMTTGSGHFDCWSSGALGTSDMVTTVPDASDFPEIVHYVFPDGRKRIVDSWACSSHTLTVANRNNMVSYLDVNGNMQFPGYQIGGLAWGSSSGPTRDERVKPDVAATGDVTLTAGPLGQIANMTISQPDKIAWGGKHMRNGGTSMASPVVAGTVALYLQKCPRATPDEIIAAINGTAWSDSLTGPVPNDHWGFGKLDAFAALVTSNVNVTLAIPVPQAFCPGVPVPVGGPSGMDVYAWSNGDSAAYTMIGQPGPVSLMVENMSGCLGRSDTLVFYQYPDPPVPVITPNGSMLESTPASAYQWILEGAPIGGATGQTYEPLVNGNYQVETTDANGCIALSDTLLFLSVGLVGDASDDGLFIWPSPAEQEINLRLPRGNVITTGEIFAMDGRQVLSFDPRSSTIFVGSLPTGLYHVRLTTQDGRRYEARFLER